MTRPHSPAAVRDIFLSSQAADLDAGIGAANIRAPLGGSSILQLRVHAFTQSDVFDRYDSVRHQIFEHMQWIYDNLYTASYLDQRVTKVKLPRSLFRDENDPRGDLSKVAVDFTSFVMRLVGDSDLMVHSIHNIRVRFEGLLKRVEAVLDQLKEVEDLFQPAVLEVICDLATKHDNPKKRKYDVGLLSFSCKRDKGKVITVHMPKNYKVPDRKPIERLKAVLLGIGASPMIERPRVP